MPLAWLTATRTVTGGTQQDCGIKKHLTSFGYFCGAYVLLSVILAVVSIAAEELWEHTIPHVGIMAAGIAAIIAGQAYAARFSARPTGLESTLYALAMCGIIIGITLVQMRISYFAQTIAGLPPAMTEVVIPILLVLHFVILRFCFPLGVRSGLRPRAAPV